MNLFLPAFCPKPFAAGLEPGRLLRRPPTLYRTFQRSRTAVTTPTIFRLSPSLLMGTPSSLPIPSDLHIIFPLETLCERRGWRSPCLGASRFECPTASYLKVSSEGTWDTAPGSQGHLNRRRLSELDHFRLKFWGAFVSSHILLLIDAQGWVRKRPREPESVRKPNKDWVNIGSKNLRLNWFFSPLGPQITPFHRTHTDPIRTGPQIHKSTCVLVISLYIKG